MRKSKVRFNSVDIRAQSAQCKCKCLQNTVRTFKIKDSIIFGNIYTQLTKQIIFDAFFFVCP